MGLGEDLLSLLSDYHTNHTFARLKAKRLDAAQIAKKKKGCSERFASDSVVRVTLSRLRTKGFIENKNGVWSITKTGLLRLRRARLPKSVPKTIGRKPKNLVIAFDIPEHRRKERDWLRIQLVHLGFTMLQKSVWFGPSPLPSAFIDSARELQLIPYMKFFEAKGSDIV